MKTFTMNDKEVSFSEGETVWQVAKREGIEIPHLCYLDKPSYRGDGNCRVCMVEIEGERVLQASCIRKASENMVVHTASERAKKSRNMVMELLMSDQPKGEECHNDDAPIWQWAHKMDVTQSRFPKKKEEDIIDDISHPAMRVMLDACIQCNLCVRACREVQVNDVIGMMGRGFKSQIIFDQNDNMGDSTCVACGECVQACPTGALMPAKMVHEDGSYGGNCEKKVDSLCPFCGVGCQTTIHVKGNEIIKVEGRDGPANQNRLCVKGRFGMDYANHPLRLTKPLIRREDAPKKTWDMDIHPDDILKYFKEATWEEAYRVASDAYKKIFSDYGHSAFAGFGSAKCSNEEAYLFQKFIRSILDTNNVDHCTRLCHASSVAALLEGIGSGAVSAPFTDALAADVIIVIGARPTENHPVAATYFKQAAKEGKKLIVMDPRGQGLVRHAWKHLNFKPGTDVAMLSAMIHHIIDQNLVNHDFIEKYVDNFEAIKKQVAAFTPEEMQHICGIDADTLKEVAEAFATASKAIIFWGMGVSQHVHGTDNARNLITLSTITGQIGREGTGLHPLRGQNNVQGASDAGLIPMMYPDYKSVEDDTVRAQFEKIWGKKLNNKKGLTVVEIINEILHDRIKAMYVLGENPAMSDPDTEHARKALASLDFLVVQEIFLTETAFFADVIFPASAFPEKWGSFTNTNRQVQLARPAITPPGAAKQDWLIICEFAKSMGYDWQYNTIEDVFEEMRMTMPSIKGISWQRLLKEDAVTYPCDHEDDAGKAVIFEEGFPTSNKRAQLVPTDLVAPDEIPDEEYPLILTTGRLLEHWHTGAMTRRANVLDSIEPEATVHLHPRHLRALSIGQGDYVIVSTRRGHIKLRAQADRDVSDGMIFIPFCFSEAPANMLTNPALDPYGKIPEFKFCAAKIQKVA